MTTVSIFSWPCCLVCLAVIAGIASILTASYRMGTYTDQSRGSAGYFSNATWLFTGGCFIVLAILVIKFVE